MAKQIEGGARSWRELGQRLNRAHQVLHRRAADGRWPAGVPTAPPWTAEHIKRVGRHQSTLPANLAEGLDGPAAAAVPDNGFELSGLSLHSKAKLKLTAERAAWIELQRKITGGEYLARDDVERDRLRRVYAVKSELLALPRAVAADFEPEVAARVEAVLRQHVLEMLERFAGESTPSEHDE